MLRTILISTKRRAFLTRWLGPFLIAATFILAAALTWRKWPNVLIDFGSQLYLPWKLSSGSVLYRDEMYMVGGPLSQYLNAALFNLFGVSLRTLIVSNLAITSALLVIIYKRFLVASDALTSTIICVGIVIGFAFAQYDDIGNYNYVPPYCHEIVHGLALSVLAIALMSDW